MFLVLLSFVRHNEIDLYPTFWVHFRNGEEDFYSNRRLGLEQTEYGTYLCQYFILSFEKLTLKKGLRK